VKVFQKLSLPLYKISGSFSRKIIGSEIKKKKVKVKFLLSFQMKVKVESF
jgi:hypothetical protein